MAELLSNVNLSKPAVQKPGPAEETLVQKHRAESTGLQENLAPIRTQMDTLGQEIAGMGDVPAAPDLQPVPQFQARQVDRQEMMNFASLATAFAALASKGVRGDITLAMNSAAEAMKGFNSGNIQQSKLDIENFNAQSRAAVQNNKQMLDEYNAVLNNRKLTLQQKLQQYNLLAHKYQDEIAMSALRKGDIRFELDRMDKLRNAQNSLEVQLANMERTLAAQMARIEASAGQRYDKPLSGVELEKYVHPVTRVRPAPGSTLRDVIAGGYEVQSVSEQNVATAAQGARATLGILGGYMDKLWGTPGKEKVEPGIVNRSWTGAKWAWETMGQSNADLIAFESFAKGTLAPLIRSTGEKGNLANQDIERAINLIPKVWPIPDTTEVAREKMENLNKWFIDATRARGVEPKIPGTGGQGVPTFSSEREAELAATQGRIKPGDRISIGGQTGVWQ